MKLKSIISHWVSNIITVLVPIIIIPFLIKNIGVVAYGDVAYIQAISMATLVVTDFGMNSIGPKLLAEKNQLCDQIEVANSMAILHLIVWVAITLVGLIYIILYTSASPLCYAFSQLSVIFNYIPAPYVAIFFGKQFEYGLINTLMRVLFAIIVFFSIRAGEGAVEYFAYTALISFLASSFGVYILWGHFKKYFRWPKYNYIVQIGGKGFNQIIRRASNLPIVVIVPALIRHMAGPEAMTIYSLTEKIRVVTWQAANPIISYFSKEIFSEERYGKSNTNCVIALSVMAVAMAVVGVLSAGFVVEKFGVNGIEGAVYIWMIGAAMIPAGVLFAYAMSILMPKEGAGKIKAINFWIISVVVILLGYGLMGINAAAAGVLTMTLFEILASLYVIFGAVKNKRVL